MTNEQEREAFEAWFDAYALSNGSEHSNWFLRDDDGDYLIADVWSSWDAWQARAALASQPRVGEHNGVAQAIPTAQQLAAGAFYPQVSGYAPVASQAAQAPVAWVHQDDPARVISAQQKATALRDGGASASSVAPYTIACHAAPLVASTGEQPDSVHLTPAGDEEVTAREDLLDMAYINSLPQPFMGRELGGWWWPIHDIEVATGLIRIDVCGKLDVKHIGDFTIFRDAAGVERSSEAFYADAIPEERAALPASTPAAGERSDGAPVAPGLLQAARVALETPGFIRGRDGLQAAVDAAGVGASLDPDCCPDCGDPECPGCDGVPYRDEDASGVPEVPHG